MDVPSPRESGWSMDSKSVLGRAALAGPAEKCRAETGALPVWGHPRFMFEYERVGYSFRRADQASKTRAPERWALGSQALTKHTL